MKTIIMKTLKYYKNKIIKKYFTRWFKQLKNILHTFPNFRTGTFEILNMGT